MSNIKNVTLHHTVLLSALLTNIALYLFFDIGFTSCLASQGCVTISSVAYFALYRIAFSKLNFTTTFINEDQQDDE